MNRVSVIIPTYKRSDRLTKAIDSVLTQTYPDVEVIVVDDNNPDTEYRRATEEKMKGYEKNARVVYLKHLKNKNGAAARNTGINYSNAEYIAFLDDDDFFYADKIRQQVDFLDNNSDFDGVYTGRVQNGKIIYAERIGDLSREILSETFTPTTCALMFRRKALLEIGCFDESFRRHQDYELLLKYFRHYTLGAIREPLVEIGISDGINDLHGEELERNKKHYLEQFHDNIESVNKKYPGFKERVWIITYRFIFFDHLSQKYFQRALYIYKKGCKTNYFRFNFELLRYAFSYINIKIRRMFLKRRK